MRKHVGVKNTVGRKAAVLKNPIKRPFTFIMRKIRIGRCIRNEFELEEGENYTCRNFLTWVVLLILY